MYNVSKTNDKFANFQRRNGLKSGMVDDGRCCLLPTHKTRMAPLDAGINCPTNDMSNDRWIGNVAGVARCRTRTIVIREIPRYRIVTQPTGTAPFPADRLQDYGDGPSSNTRRSITVIRRLTAWRRLPWKPRKPCMKLWWRHVWLLSWNLCIHSYYAITITCWYW